MQLLKRRRAVTGLAGIAFVAVFGLATAAQAEIVANLGTLTLGVAETVGCNTQPSCTTTTGTSGGSLPASGTFVHQIRFSVPVTANVINSTQVLDSTTIDVANMTVQLFLQTGGSTALGGTATGTLLATATSNTFAGTTNFALNFGSLNPANTYFIQITGAGSGVLNSGASYSDQVKAVAPVPLPPALFLLAAALAGVVGYSRIRRDRA